MSQPAPQTAVTTIDLLRAVFTRKWLVLGLALLGAAAAATYALLAEPVYEASAIIAPVSAQDGSPIAALGSRLGGGIGQLIGMNANSATRAVQIATLESRVLALSFAKEQKLESVLFQDRWDAARKAWRPDASAPTDLEVATRLKSNVLSVEDDKTKGLVTVSARWSDPRLAAEWTNKYIDHANRAARRVAISEANQNLAYLYREFERTQPVEIRQAIASLIESEMSRKAIASVRLEYAYRVVDPAQPPLVRVFPRRTLITAGGLLAGTAVGVAIALVLALRALTRSPPTRIPPGI